MDRPLVNVSQVAVEIESLLEEEREPDGSYVTSSIEVDLEDLICWRDSILNAHGHSKGV